jgi:hypothetical protein
MESLYLLVAIGNVLWFSQIDLGYTGIHNFAMPQALPAIIRAVCDQKIIVPIQND